jgi:Chemotaxis protein
MGMAEQRDESAVYKQLSTEMRQGLKNIYQQISSASSDQGTPVSDTDALFHEASDQLGEVLKATETAAVNIMEIVEKHLDLQTESAALLEAVRSGTAADTQTARLAEINNQLGDDLTTLLTILSFQDITGQRIKKVVEALNKIEKSVVELYVSSGLIMEGAEKNPHKDVQTLQDEARKAVEDFRQNRRVSSELKGPDANGFSQNAIDDMLAQLGM